ncbi:hypothetical protein [Halolactibacillus alkaliphilus]|nr:hypothetical protein [Halolactibacillus alkaliphilus]SFO98789.1 hypothetical protein SAMN05720591_1298 [Halolactibacillus alkaliphilus]
MRRIAFSTGPTFESIEADYERIVVKLKTINDRSHPQHKLSRRELLLAEREAIDVMMIQSFDAAFLVDCRIKIDTKTMTCYIDGK